MKRYKKGVDNNNGIREREGEISFSLIVAPLC